LGGHTTLAGPKKTSCLGNDVGKGKVKRKAGHLGSSKKEWQNKKNIDVRARAGNGPIDRAKKRGKKTKRKEVTDLKRRGGGKLNRRTSNEQRQREAWRQ